MKTPVMTWVNKIGHHLRTRGMEGAFSIRIDNVAPAAGTWVQFIG